MTGRVPPRSEHRVEAINLPCPRCGVAALEVCDMEVPPHTDRRDQPLTRRVEYRMHAERVELAHFAGRLYRVLHEARFHRHHWSFGPPAGEEPRPGTVDHGWPPLHHSGPGRTDPSRL